MLANGPWGRGVPDYRSNSIESGGSGLPTLMTFGRPTFADGGGYKLRLRGRVVAGEARWEGHRCAFRLEPPPPGDPLPDMGRITCFASHAQGGTR